MAFSEISRKCFIVSHWWELGHILVIEKEITNKKEQDNSLVNQILPFLSIKFLNTILYKSVGLECNGFWVAIYNVLANSTFLEKKNKKPVTLAFDLIWPQTQNKKTTGFLHPIVHTSLLFFTLYHVKIYYCILCSFLILLNPIVSMQLNVEH